MGGPNGPGGQLGQTNTLSQYGKANQIMTSIASGVGQPVTPIDQLIQSKINPLALPRQAAEYAQQLRDSVYVKKQKLGFNFTVTATLVNPPVAPAVPGSASSANANGMGGMGGFGGGGTVGGPDAGAPPWAQGS